MPTLPGYCDIKKKNMLKGARNGKLSKSKDLNGSQKEQVILDWVTNAFKMLLSKNRIKNTEASRNVNYKSAHYIWVSHHG